MNGNSEIKPPWRKFVSLNPDYKQRTTTLNIPGNPTTSFHTRAQGIPNRAPNPPVNNKKHTHIYCKRSHPPTACETVTDSQTWLKLVKQLNFCFNCLAHHRVSQYNSKHHCRKCNCKHHASLCSETDNTSERNSNMTAMTTILSTLTTSHYLVDNQCLLKTAVATVSTSDTYIEALMKAHKDHSWHKV